MRWLLLKGETPKHWSSAPDQKPPLFALENKPRELNISFMSYLIYKQWVEYLIYKLLNIILKWNVETCQHREQLHQIKEATKTVKEI